MPAVLPEGVRLVRRQDEDYPDALRQIHAPPQLLYVRGALPDPKKKSVAIVGARACSAYGKAEAVRFARELAAHGVQIISGMAAGIDAWAHHGALEAGGATFAVLGTGVDICYPASSRRIYERMPREGGGILSEFSPGDAGEPWHFPVRNRIISGLADLVLVVEARRKSGSLITADLALEQGRTVFAVPGRNADRTSEGCNYLIAQGAGIATDPGAILCELGLNVTAAKTPRVIAGGTALEERILSLLREGERNLDQLLADTKASQKELSSALLHLRLNGAVAERVRGFYSCI